mmetsp:Transcript_29598/g.40664  ORF Transcript_29598/g.40664 Transcript_29598/m.40664 type:complete len:87 (+) Transcript_29598:373-633(+)
MPHHVGQLYGVSTHMGKVYKMSFLNYMTRNVMRSSSFSFSFPSSLTFIHLLSTSIVLAIFYNDNVNLCLLLQLFQSLLSTIFPLQQ